MEQMLLLASIFGCTLNGEPAKLDALHKQAGTLCAVTGTKSGQRVVFTLAVAEEVLKRHKGEFRTLEARKWGCA